MAINIISITLKEKNCLTGIAIICIILCHFGVVDSELFQSYSFLKVFVPGFIGVDIFLFFSGYSLGFSLESRGLKEFYKKRFKRIYPMFCLFAILSTIVFILKGTEVSLFDWFCNITTLSYYHVGGQPVDWYLSSIALFYIAYPIGYKYVNKHKTGGVILLTSLIFLITSFHDFYEYYGCAISRIPIFVLGIYMYKIRDNVSLSKNYYILTLIFLFFGILAMVLMKYGFKIHGYYLVDTVTPLLLIVLTLILLCYRRLSFSDHIDYGLSFFGKYSLEIYISNYLSMNIIGLFKEADMYEKAYIYIALNIIGFICMIFANKAISKVIK